MCIRVLQVVTILDRGGAETMIMNYYRQIDRTKIQFDFLVHRSEKGIYEEEIEALGGKIYRAFPIRPWNYSKYRKWLQAFFEEHKEYSAVHAHILENCGFVIEAAKKADIPIRIAHSHLAQVNYDYKYLFRLYGKYVLKHSGTTKKFACGKDAGAYLYDNGKFDVLPNAIDTDSFVFNKEIRNRKRRELNITGQLVVGNVARFHPVKNQAYLVEIFAALHEKKHDSMLLLIGNGEEKEYVRKQVYSLGLEDCVQFLDVRTDVNELLQAIDVFVFPSKLEGLPLSLIEAQAAGLPCLLSDRVAKETAITDLVHFIHLEDTPEQWADKIIDVTEKFIRPDMTESIKEAGYDIKNNAEWLQKIYLGQQ